MKKSEKASKRICIINDANIKDAVNYMKRCDELEKEREKRNKANDPLFDKIDSLNDEYRELIKKLTDARTPVHKDALRRLNFDVYRLSKCTEEFDKYIEKYHFPLETEAVMLYLNWETEKLNDLKKCEESAKEYNTLNATDFVCFDVFIDEYKKGIDTGETFNSLISRL